MKKIAMAALLTVSLCLPVRADHFDVFITSVNRTGVLIGQYEYDKALAEANTAEIAYKRALKELASFADASEAYKLKLAMQANLVLIYNLLGQRLFDNDRFPEALRVYDKAIGISPDFPCLHYEKGYTYQRMKSPWKAAVSVYEAQRLARFPARRNIINHFDEDGSIYCGRGAIDPRAQTILSELGKPLLYPIEVNLKTGQKSPGRILPGLGANVVRPDQNVNVYLEQPLADVVKNLGEPLSEETILYRDGRELPHYIYEGLMVVVNPTDQNVIGLYVFSPQAYVETPNGNLAVGADAKSVLKTLGKSFGFVKNHVGINSDIRDSLSYPELSLDLAIAKHDALAMILIYTLE